MVLEPSNDDTDPVEQIETEVEAGTGDGSGANQLRVADDNVAELVLPNFSWHELPPEKSFALKELLDWFCWKSAQERFNCLQRETDEVFRFNV